LGIPKVVWENIEIITLFSWNYLDVDELIKQMVQMVKWSLWKYGFQKGHTKDWDLQLSWLIMRYKSSQQLCFVSFSPYILLFGHKLKLPTSIWQDVMMVINLDDQNIWGSSMWIVNNLIPTCNANGYGEFGNQSTPKHMFVCHYLRR
jgi:hypothetical protein